MMETPKVLVAYLLGKKILGPHFFFLRYTRDEEGGIEKMFWCDRICRKNYKAFRIVIVFDTTYKIMHIGSHFLSSLG